MILLLATSSPLFFGGCDAGDSAEQKKLFAEAAEEESQQNPMSAAQLYREAARLDPTSRLGVQALDRAGKMDKQYESDRAELEERLARTH